MRATTRLCDVNLSDLGPPTGPIVRVHGGFANRMYRLDTEMGSFAFKELILVDGRSAYPVRGCFTFERAALAAGVAAPGISR
jgi:hypothetical protein